MNTELENLEKKKQAPFSNILFNLKVFMFTIVLVVKNGVMVYILFQFVLPFFAGDSEAKKKDAAFQFKEKKFYDPFNLVRFVYFITYFHSFILLNATFSRSHGLSSTF